MSASEKSGQNPIPWTRPYAVPDYPDIMQSHDPDTADVYAGMGELSAVPDPFPDETRTAAQAARGAGNTLWTAVRAHKAMTAGAAAGAAAALTLAYGLGRRARRRGLGPVALLLERHF
ncbi:hypothetical protein ABZY16_36700 [Streptomyces sp. NPDC006553]|uniref:hypothetical protein n=1 Tax=unclassified Streptomyces TaxID=2593676 RepID=UPI002256DD17|nr:hypothetical protein [Streptomyces sp. NBC_00233]MCX5232460.1 hypothetical protein [Streptomyces sp. NBC_00233]